MISSVILTIKINKSKNEYDMELPANMKISELSIKILESLRNLEAEIFQSVNRIGLKFYKTDSILGGDETLESAHVWSGSILTVLY